MRERPEGARRSKVWVFELYTAWGLRYVMSPAVEQGHLHWSIDRMIERTRCILLCKGSLAHHFPLVAYELTIQSRPCIFVCMVHGSRFVHGFAWAPAALMLIRCQTTSTVRPRSVPVMPIAYWLRAVTRRLKEGHFAGLVKQPSVVHV
jgi:hypothetical protein